MISRRSQKKDGPMSGWQWSYEWLAVVFYNFEDKPMVKIMANSHHQIPMPFFPAEVKAILRTSVY